jgi:hypothetical protein
MFNKTTTDLEVIRSQPRRHTWGPVTKIHDVGRYSIVEYLSADSINPANDDRTLYAVYVDGKNVNISDPVFEQALLFAIAFGASTDGATEAGAMARAAAKVLGIWKGWA